MSEVGHSRAEMVELLEQVVQDVRLGRPSFVALAVITPSARDPTKPVVAVGKYGRTVPGQVSALFAELADDAQELGALVPD